jgi:phage baseplate assembly protein V
MAENTGGVSYKVGLVYESRPGYGRVQFPDLDGMVSGWLPMIVKKSLKDKEVLTLDIGEQVACVLDEYFESGCILGAVFSDDDLPPVVSHDKYHFAFFDGGSFEYDRNTGQLTIVTTGAAHLTAGGDTTIKAPSVTLDTPSTTCTGNLLVKGGLTYQGGMTGSGGSGGASASISGGVYVTGDIAATGTILDAGGNSNHHVH